MSYLSEWRGLFRHWRSDLVAGLAVAIVALPLALGFAITTGAPPSAGLVTAIVAGFIAALFGGSNFQVSGPTGAMTVVLVPIVAQYGVESLVFVGFIAGALIILMALLGLGRFIDKVPLAVMEGFTLGIAAIIALQQIPLIFEVTKAPGIHTLSVAFDTLKLAISSPINWASICIVFLTLLIKRSWPRFRLLLRVRIHIPGSIIAVAVATLVTQFLNLKIARIGEIPVNLFQFKLPSFPEISILALLYAALIVALLGAIESLLSARVADSLSHRTANQLLNGDSIGVFERHDPKKELIGQGLATAASALAGGLPATGAIARTSVNVNAGARTRLAAMSHAIFLLLAVLLLSPLVEKIPTAALAGVLLGTSIRIANPKSVMEALRSTTDVRFVYLATAISVIFIDLIWGVAIGIAITYIINRIKMFRLKRQQNRDESQDKGQ